MKCDRRTRCSRTGYGKSTFAQGIKIPTRPQMMGIGLEISVINSFHNKKAALVLAKRSQRASSLSVILAPDFTGKAPHFKWFLSVGKWPDLTPPAIPFSAFGSSRCVEPRSSPASFCLVFEYQKGPKKAFKSLRRDHGPPHQGPRATRR